MTVFQSNHTAIACLPGTINLLLPYMCINSIKYHLQSRILSMIVNKNVVTKCASENIPSFSCSTLAPFSKKTFTV